MLDSVIDNYLRVRNQPIKNDEGEIMFYSFKYLYFGRFAVQEIFSGFR